MVENMQDKSKKIFLRVYGGFFAGVGGIALAIVLGISVISLMEFFQIENNCAGPGCGYGMLAVWLTFIPAVLVLPFAIYYLVCGIKICRGKYTTRRLRVHNCILLVLSVLQTLLMICITGWGFQFFFGDAVLSGLANIVLIVISSTMSIMTIISLVKIRGRGEVYPANGE